MRSNKPAWDWSDCLPQEQEDPYHQQAEIALPERMKYRNEAAPNKSIIDRGDLAIKSHVIIHQLIRKDDHLLRVVTDSSDGTVRREKAAEFTLATQGGRGKSRSKKLKVNLSRFAKFLGARNRVSQSQVL